MTTFEVIEGGGVSTARGFRAGAKHAGFRSGDSERLDLALIVSDEPCAAAATFTTNVFCAAPVMVSRKHLSPNNTGTARAIVINSGNANAATGDRGLQLAHEVCEEISTLVGCEVEEVLIASTGVIGQHLSLDPFTTVLPELVNDISTEGGAQAARAIMTTDTYPKEYAITYESSDPSYQGKRFHVGGMCKGSGMIMPNMATMIAVITTDAPVDAPVLHTLLSYAVQHSFNKVTVDSDTSTNDTCFALASGLNNSELSVMREGTLAFLELQDAFCEVCSHLAREIARDGEGATRLITVRVVGASNERDADLAARSIANSPLVKTAIYGHDCNWGRIAAALGKSGACFDQRVVSIDIMGLAVCREGLAVPFDEDEALRRFENPEVEIWVDLGVGTAETTVWTCDFSHEYVTINGDYRT